MKIVSLAETLSKDLKGFDVLLKKKEGGDLVVSLSTEITYKDFGFAESYRSLIMEGIRDKVRYLPMIDDLEDEIGALKGKVAALESVNLELQRYKTYCAEAFLKEDY